MQKLNYLSRVKEIYDNGGNIIEYLKSLNDSDDKGNSIEDILISYDFQAGSYIDDWYNLLEFNLKYTKSIADEINKYGPFESILEVGIGEGTIFSGIVSNLDNIPKRMYGIDLSMSRLNCAEDYIQESLDLDVELACANMMELPYEDDSIDLVFSVHAAEPNGGNEAAILKELYRVAKKYVIMFEPSYELASDEGKERMNRHGYVKYLDKEAKSLNFDVVAYESMPLSYTPLNPTSVLVIKKESNNKCDQVYRCPITSEALINHNDEFMYAPTGFIVYPIIRKIPCLLRENAILASNINKFIKK